MTGGRGPLQGKAERYASLLSSAPGHPLDRLRLELTHGIGLPASHKLARGCKLRFTHQQEAELHNGAVAPLVGLHACRAVALSPVLPWQAQLHVLCCAGPLLSFP